jgi:putative DNA primase/helicase
MVDSNTGDESDDSRQTTDADEQNTTNGYNDGLGFGTDGRAGSAAPDDADSTDGVEPSTESTDDDDVDEDESCDEVTMEDVEDSFDTLANDDEFEDRVEEVVEDEGGSVPLKQLTFQLAHEFDEEPEDVDEALNVVAATDDGDVVGTKSASQRAMSGGQMTWDGVKMSYGRSPYNIGIDSIQSKSDATEWARQRCFEFMNDQYSWMYLVDKSQGIENFYWYDEERGIFADDAKDRVGSLMDEHLGRHSSTHEMNEVARKLKMANKVTSVDDVNAGDRPLRCVKNGVINIETWELLEHDPEYRFTRRLNAHWDEDVDTSRIEEYLRDITASEQDAKVIAEMFGDVLTKHYRRQWFGMFYGEGANSKSLLLNSLRYTAGEDNTSSESLHDIADTRWSGAMMAGGTGSLANIDPEIPASTIYDASEIKNNTGNDATSHERKGVDKFNAVNTAKMLFGMNGAAKFEEEKRAVVRRIKPIHLPYEYLPEDEVDDDNDFQKVRDQDLEDELTTEDNRAAWLQVMAEGLRRLRENDGFSYEQTQQELFDEYQAAADTFWNFQTQCLTNVRTTYKDSDLPVYLTFNEIYSAYSSFCHERNEQPVGEGELAKKLNKIGSLDIEKYHPADADGANSRKYLVFTDTGFEHAMTSTLKRFATRVDDVDVPNMESDDDSDDGNDSEADEHAARKRAGAEVLVKSIIGRLNEQNASGATYRAIVEHCRDNSDLSGVLDALDELEERGEVETDTDGVYSVVETDSDDSDNSAYRTVVRGIKDAMSGDMDTVSVESVAGKLFKSPLGRAEIDAVLESMADDDHVILDDDGSQVALTESAVQEYLDGDLSMDVYPTVKGGDE